MRNIIPIVFVGATMLVGCHSTSNGRTSMPTSTVAARRSFHPMFITMLGTTTITPDGIWRVVVSAAGDSVDLSYRDSPTQADSPYRAWSTVGVPGQTENLAAWKAQAGWFVFIESESRVWVYDGDRHLCLEVNTPGHGSFYPSPRGFPCAVPAQVFSRLSKRAQEQIQTHD
jgi:hypothetical protein